ncbi:MAG: hypothetical protein RLZZ303_2907 [Candidatus Hydrogenedentota bacterium]|jgi:hypothetical protein
MPRPVTKQSSGGSVDGNDIFTPRSHLATMPWDIAESVQRLIDELLAGLRSLFRAGWRLVRRGESL